MLFVFSPKCKYIVLGSSLWLRKFDDGGMFFGFNFFLLVFFWFWFVWHETCAYEMDFIWLTCAIFGKGRPCQRKMIWKLNSMEELKIHTKNSTKSISISKINWIACILLRYYFISINSLKIYAHFFFICLCFQFLRCLKLLVTEFLFLLNFPFACDL